MPLPDRRSFLAVAGAALALPALAATPSPAGFREAIVIDGNLVADMLGDEGRVDPAAAAQVRASGLTAFKQTMGGTGAGFAETSQEIGVFDAAIARNPTLFAKVVEVGDIAAAKRTGRTGIVFSFESAAMLEGRLDRIDQFRARGVRVMGLSYNVGSPFGSGTMVPNGGGLTALGAQAVARMNAQGVTVDLSHSDEPTGLEAVRVSRRPVLITHAGCAQVHPHPRNKSDRLLRALADRGGVVGIYELSYLGDYPRTPTLGTYMRHLVHALRVCGEEHVGIGSDALFQAFDTSPASMAAWARQTQARRAAGVAAPEEGPPPFVEGLNGPLRWEVIAGELTRAGYRATTVDRVLGRNFQRVFADTW